MSWFQKLFGFTELAGGKHRSTNYLKTKQMFSVIETLNGNGVLHCSENGKHFPIGTFNCLSLKELRKSTLAQQISHGSSSYAHIPVSDILTMHRQYPGATFQAASQFNCLEFASPDYTPEDGVTVYGNDNTQGPACALACAAGTVYRNYFAPNGKHEGQTEANQINNLIELEKILDNDTNIYWKVHNGYVFSQPDDLLRLNAELGRWQTQGRWDDLLAAVRVGVHNDVGVTFGERFQPLANEVSITHYTLACYHDMCVHFYIHAFRTIKY
jgi:hypothetical protein